MYVFLLNPVPLSSLLVRKRTYAEWRRYNTTRKLLLRTNASYIRECQKVQLETNVSVYRNLVAKYSMCVLYVNCYISHFLLGLVNSLKRRNLQHEGNLKIYLFLAPNLTASHVVHILSWQLVFKYC